MGVVNKSELLVGVVNAVIIVGVVNKTMGVISGCGQQDYGTG